MILGLDIWEHWEYNSRCFVILFIYIKEGVLDYVL